jgi:hypothetical protein
MNMTSVKAVEAVVPPVASDYIYATKELTKLYKSINMSLLSLPIASAKPFFVSVSSIAKFSVGLIFDLFLFIPINIIVSVRNLFPGRWGYKSFSWPYIH